MTTLILSLLLLLTVMVSALVGFIRGLNKSVIRIMTFALAIIMTFVIAGPVSAAIADAIVFDNQTLGEILLENACSVEMIANIIEAAPLMKEAILVAPAFVIAILIFPVIFLLLKFLTWIVYLFVQKPLRKLIFKDDGQPKEESGKVRIGKKFAGLGIGAVTGVLIFGMLMAPLFGIFSVLPQRSALDEVIDTLTEQGTIKDQATADMIKYELGAIDSFTVKMYSFLGLTPAGKAYLASVSKIEHDGEKTHLTNEFGSLFDVVQTAIEGGLLKALMDSQNTEALYAVLADAEFVDSLMKDMFDSKLLRAAIPEITAIAMESAARMLGVPETKREVYANMMDEIANIVKESDIDFDAIREYEEAMGITHVDSVDGSSPRKSIMTEEEYKKEIEKLRKLEQDIAKVVKNNVGDGNEAAASAIASQFVKCLEEQAKEHGKDSLKAFTSEKVVETISNIIRDNIEIVIPDEDNVTPSDKEQKKEEAKKSANEMLDMMTGGKEFETQVATVETITESIRETIKEAVKDDSSSEETASTLANVVSNLAGAVSGATDENGKLDTGKLDFGKVADAVDSLQGSSTLKDVGSSVLDMVASGDLGKNDAVKDAIQGVKDSYDKGEEIGETIEFAGAAIEFGGAMKDSEGETTDVVIDSFGNLIDKLSESTLKLIPYIITENTIIGMGVPEEHAKAAYGVLETLLNELIKVKGAANYDSEVRAVLALYNIATQGTNKLNETDIKELAGYAVASDAIYNTLASVSTSNPFGIDIKSETFSDAIEKGYAESGKTQREYDVYSAIAKLLGLEDEVDLV